MCKICKTCRQSNFGVILKKTDERAARMVNGEILEYFKGSEQIQEKILINYCFTCSKEITDNDLIEMHICKVCRNEVETIDENGVCPECSKEANKLLEISREELILMILRQNRKIEEQLSDIYEQPKKDEEELSNIYEQPKKDGEELSNICEQPKKDGEELSNIYENSRKDEEESSNISELPKKNKRIILKKEEKLVKNNKKSDTIKKRNKIAHKINTLIVETDNTQKTCLKSKAKPNNKVNNIKKENKTPLILQENIDEAINNNEKKVKSIHKSKSPDVTSLDNVIDKSVYDIKEIKDVVNVKDIQEAKDIDIIKDVEESTNNYNSKAENVDSEMVNNILNEIENIVSNMNCNKAQ